MSGQKTYLAVIRCLEIIGEASANVPSEIQGKYPKVEWRKAKDFRNFLSHVYFGIDPDVVWKTLQTDLIALESELKNIPV